MGFFVTSRSRKDDNNISGIVVLLAETRLAVVGSSPADAPISFLIAIHCTIIDLCRVRENGTVTLFYYYYII